MARVATTSRSIGRVMARAANRAPMMQRIAATSPASTRWCVVRWMSVFTSASEMPTRTVPHLTA